MYTNNAIDKLLELSSMSTGSGIASYCNLPEGLRPLYDKDGFLAFESALEVFPVNHSNLSYSAGRWNRHQTWKIYFKDLSPKGFCFAQDLFGTQFLIVDKIFSFDPETGEMSFVAESIQEWATKILLDYRVMTAQPLAHAWQLRHGPLPARSRLVPIVPFILGGAYEVSNLVAMDAIAAMRLRADLALQLRDLPDGAQVIYEVK